ncbi:polysaccharide deacetylase family protein [Yinghuangia soli]|uniref:Polysaccharide deacetylase family protein n=1 Tax=Yinghuangia soli TaxID=2908204 RepID=A0AA41U2H5_9ACTN|nr:polysaccharide deacetylase family protein [Yinghuangia soli]MCF2527114.1 polysaccharide deacetylase family protein [Yinghuangia soli]
MRRNPEAGRGRGTARAVAGTAGAALLLAIAACGTGGGGSADRTPPPAAASGDPSAPTAGGESRSSHRMAPDRKVSPEITRETEAGGKAVALTIDDGPDPRSTPQMLDLLKQHNAKATFCMLGPAAKAHPDLVKRVAAEGHRLCNHSMSHNVRQSSESEDYNRNEIVEANRLIQEAAGPDAKIWYYRAPGGDFKPWIRDIAAENGLRPLGWNVDSDDWKRDGTAAIVDRLKQQIKPGRVALLHDGGGERSQSVAALAEILDHLDAEGYTYSFPKA